MLRDSASTPRKCRPLRLLVLEGPAPWIDHHDPHIPVTPRSSKYNLNKACIELTAEKQGSYDFLMGVTGHSVSEPELIVPQAQLIVGIRNLIKNLMAKVNKA